MTGPPRFLGSRPPGEGPICLLGVPWEGTLSGRPGTADGPADIRLASDLLETYSPRLDCCLVEDAPVADHGDLRLTPGPVEAVLEQVAAAVRPLLAQDLVPVLLGGEHLITLPAVREAHRRHDDLVVVQLDAHADLRESYEGQSLSHASVMHHVARTVGLDSLVQVGIRSGTREEWQIMREHGTLLDGVAPEELRQRLADLSGRPLYVTVDLDILDPSCLPGTGTPEPGGPGFGPVVELLAELQGHRVVAADVVELAPGLDPGGCSSVVAAKIVRELLLVAHPGRRGGFDTEPRER